MGTYCSADGYLYSIHFDSPTPPHQGRLIRIDPATGVGTSVGPLMGADVRIVGLAYDPDASVFYGVTSGWATKTVVELYMVDLDGNETLLGLTGTPLGNIQSLVMDQSVTPAKLYAAGTWPAPLE